MGWFLVSSARQIMCDYASWIGGLFQECRFIDVLSL